MHVSPAKLFPQHASPTLRTATSNPVQLGFAFPANHNRFVPVFRIRIMPAGMRLILPPCMPSHTAHEHLKRASRSDTCRALLATLAFHTIGRNHLIASRASMLTRKIGRYLDERRRAAYGALRESELRPHTLALRWRNSNILASHWKRGGWLDKVDSRR